ncbi:MAG: tyrosine-protein phosphatase [Desulfobacterales bacterium]
MTDETMDPRRHIALESLQNFRDLGGYSTVDGRRTRWGRFTRCAGMQALTTADQQKMIDYGIGTVVDLRMLREVEKSPNPFADSKAVAYHNLDLWGDRVADFKSAKSSLTQAEKMADLYRTGFVRCEGIIAEIIGTLADEKDHASVFHCGAGKDRTGLVAALLLGVVGVPHETIAADYALTGLYLADPNRDHENPDPMFIPESEKAKIDDGGQPLPVYMFSCLPETMRRALAFLDENYGGVEGYVRKIGVTGEQIDRLRSTFLV